MAAGAIYDPDNPFFFSLVRRREEKKRASTTILLVAAALSKSHAWGRARNLGRDLVRFGMPDGTPSENCPCLLAVC